MTVLITGKNGYIGKCLEARLREKNPQWLVKTASVRDALPSLQAVDVLVHAAALVHTRSKSARDFDRVNRLLTLELAEKARDCEVGHFIFLSTMAVYGADSTEPVIISASTPCCPVTDYGRSKLAAEEGLRAMALSGLSIVRPPMVYGPGCPGNYAKLQVLAKWTPIFPYVENQRSMLHIDNLCELIHLMILHKQQGLFCPQDERTVNTSLLVKELGRQQNNRVFLSKPLGRLVCKTRSKFIWKIFGTLVYEQGLSAFPYHYRIAG